MELLLIGGGPDILSKPGSECKAAKTALHLDWLDAVNLAVGMAVEFGEPVALWLCCVGDPEILGWLIEECDHRCAPGVPTLWDGKLFGGKLNVEIPQINVNRMIEIKGKADVKFGIHRVWLEEQKSGHVFQVPAGIAHAVCNLAPCIKLGLDGVKSVHTFTHMMVALSKLVPMFGPRLPMDYGHIRSKLEKAFFSKLVALRL